MKFATSCSGQTGCIMNISIPFSHYCMEDGGVAGETGRRNRERELVALQHLYVAGLSRRVSEFPS